MMTRTMTKTTPQIAAVAAKMRPECPRALVVAGGAAHEDPRLVEAAQDRERAEQQHEQADEARSGCRRLTLPDR